MRKALMPLGAALAATGLVLALVSRIVVGSVAGTAIGISVAAVGATSLGLGVGGTRPANGLGRADLGIQGLVLVSLAVAFGIIDGLLALFNSVDLSVYVTLGAMAYFVITWVSIAVDPRLRTALTATGAIVFGGFLITLAVKVVGILR